MVWRICTDNLHYEKFADRTVKCIEDEIPFDVPEGWEWARIGSVCIINPRNNISDSLDVSFIPMPLISEGYANTHSYEIRTWNKVKNGFTHFAENDIGIAKITPCFENRKSVIFKDLVNGYGAGTTELHILRTLDNTIANEYLLWIAKMDSFIQGGIHSFSGAVGQQRVGKDYLSQYLIPIPPRNEQIRIIQKINLIFKFVIAIENEKRDLEEIIQQAKSKILDLAIRGKLVSQDPTDEPAFVLLERIRTEKEELIKKGKIKRDKKESIIFKAEDNSYYEKIDGEVRCIDEEIPFEIPDTWEWIRLEDLCQKEIRRGKSPKYAQYSQTLVFAQKCNTKYNGIDIGLAQFLDENTLSKYPVDEFMKDGDIVINSTGTGTLGRVGFYQTSDNIKNIDIVPDSHVTVVRAYKNINSFYLYAFMKFNQSELEKKGEGSTNQKELKPATLKEMFVPIPSITEQERISAAILKVFSIITAIERSLS